ncbi:hypothetical protein [Formivibrio citricus]|uniref:hypothetical protein n=1 Tax=Formivibrio citricus TaxID=83765 RepID=UPI0011607BA8|nr:hypothetical protein [Formivibrio citricus]
MFIGRPLTDAPIVVPPHELQINKPSLHFFLKVNDQTGNIRAHPHGTNPGRANNSKDLPPMAQPQPRCRQEDQNNWTCENDKQGQAVSQAAAALEKIDL